MPHLDAIEVEGYKSIRSAAIALGAVNVLIGANGTGKSNLLGFFGLLADLADRRLQLHVARKGGADAMLHFGRKTTPAFRFILVFGAHGYHASLVPTADDTLVFEGELPTSFEPPERTSPPPPAKYVAPPGYKETVLTDEGGELESTDALAIPVIAGMKSWRQFHFHDTGASAPLKQKRKLDDNRTLRPDAENLAPFLFALQRIAPGAYRRIIEAVRAVAPFFDDFVLAPDVVNANVIQLAWRHKTADALFTADSLSDGTLRFICLATLLLQPELPSMVVIDEPELGLHPFAISHLVGLIRAASIKTQVLLATQSVTLLNHFVASEVIVAERENGESTFRRLDEAALAEWLQEYSLGELWLKNVLGGRPR